MARIAHDPDVFEAFYREHVDAVQRFVARRIADPHLAATDFFPVVEHPTEGAIRSMRVSATWSDTPAEPARLAPRLGEHSREILQEAGFSHEEMRKRFRHGLVDVRDEEILPFHHLAEGFAR